MIWKTTHFATKSDQNSGLDPTLVTLHSKFSGTKKPTFPWALMPSLKAELVARARFELATFGL
jgi:hypothetical protein